MKPAPTTDQECAIPSRTVLSLLGLPHKVAIDVGREVAAGVLIESDRHDKADATGVTSGWVVTANALRHNQLGGMRYGSGLVGALDQDIAVAHSGILVFGIGRLVRGEQLVTSYNAATGDTRAIPGSERSGWPNDVGGFRPMLDRRRGCAVPASIEGPGIGRDTTALCHD